MADEKKVETVSVEEYNKVLAENEKLGKMIQELLNIVGEQYKQAIITELAKKHKLGE